MAAPAPRGSVVELASTFSMASTASDASGDGGGSRRVSHDTAHATPRVFIDVGHERLNTETDVYMTPSLKHRVYVTHDAHSLSDAPRKSTVGAGDAWGGGDGSGGDGLPALTRLTAACYSVGHFLNDATASCWFSYLLLYLQDAQGLSGIEAGIVLFSGQVFDAMATPIVGLLSDRSAGLPALGLGRRKTWNFFGVLVVTVCFFFVFGLCLPCLADGAAATSVAKTVSFAVFASAFNVGWAAVQVSHMCMVPELTNDEGQRVMLNSARYAFTVLANVYVFVAMWLILNFYDGGSSNNRNSSTSYSLLTYAVLGFGGLLSVAFLVGTRERMPDAYARLRDASDPAATALLAAPAPVPTGASDAGSSSGGGGGGGGGGDSAASDAVADWGTTSVASTTKAHSGGGGGGKVATLRHVASLGALRPAVMTWRDWLRMLDFYKVAAVYMFTRLATNVSQVYLTFFVTVALKMDQTAIAIVPLLVYLSSLVATIVMKRLDRRLGRRNSMTLGSVLFGASCVIMMFLRDDTATLIYPTVLLLGMGSAITMVISVSLEADLVGRNVESAAFLYGAISLTDKLSNGIAILGIQYIGNGINDEESHEAFIRYVNALVPAVAAGLALLVTWTIQFPSHLRGADAASDAAAASINRLARGADGRSDTLAVRMRTLLGLRTAPPPPPDDADADDALLSHRLLGATGGGGAGGGGSGGGKHRLRAAT